MIMDDTDFDLLCEGASAVEAKRLRKIMAEWCDGEEDSFPVQLALLTRAQWRVAATIPRSVEEARKLLQLEFALQREQVTMLVKDFEQTTTAHADKLDGLIKTQTANTTQTVAGLRGHLAESEKTAKQIRQELEAGARKWSDAILEFDRAFKRLMQLCADLQARPWRSHWVLLGLLIVAVFVAGYFIGLHYHR